MVTLRFSCLAADVHRWEMNVFRVAERSRPGLSSEVCLGPYASLGKNSLEGHVVRGDKQSKNLATFTASEEACKREQLFEQFS